MKNKQIEIAIKAIDQISKPLNTMGGKINKFGKGITAAFGKIGIAGGAIVGGLGGMLTLEFDEAFKNLQVQTGLAGDAFKDLKSTSLDLFAKGFGRDIQTSIRAVSILNRELDLTGDELKEVAKGGLLIADAFDKDVNEVLRATTGLMKTYGISGQEANDLLLKALQQTGDQYDDLLDTVNEFSIKTSSAGLGYEDFINILITGTKAGIRNTDELGNLLQENVIRISDGSKKTRESFKKLGLSYEKDYVEKVKKNGGNISDLIFDISKRTTALKDPLLQTAIAADLYGTKFEDNSIVIIKSLSEMENHLGDFNGLVEESGKIVEDSLGSSWKQFKVTLVETLDPLKENVSAVTAWMRENEALTATLTKIGIIIGGIAAGLAILGGIVAGIGALLSSTLAIFVAIGAAALGIGYVFGMGLHGLFKLIKKSVMGIWDWVKGIGAAIKDFFTFGDSDQTIKLEKNLTSNINASQTGGGTKEKAGSNNSTVNNVTFKVEGSNVNEEELANKFMTKLNDQNQLFNRGVV